MNNKFMREGQKLPTSAHNINVNDLPMHICPKCSNTAFSDATEIRILSAILSPSGKDEIIKVPVAICSLCGAKVMNSDIEKSTMKGLKEGGKNDILQS